MFQLASPWLLLLLPLPLIYRYFCPPSPAKSIVALKLPMYHRLTTLDNSAETLDKSTQRPLSLAMLIWALLLIAACGPEWLGKPIALPREGRNILLAIDLSGSMQIPDMDLKGQQANRLQAVKSIASQFIDQRHGDKLGLIVFGSKAYLQTPLTYDRQTVKTMLLDSSIGLAGQQTAIADSIGLAVKRLEHYSADSRIVILLTDGADNRSTVSLEDAAKIAAQKGIKIYTIGFGSDKLIVQGLFGPRTINPSAELDENILNQIATTTGGQYFRAKNTKTLTQVYDTINQLEPVGGEHSIYRPTTPLYPWPLAMAFFITIIMAWRKISHAFGHPTNSSPTRGIS